MSGIELAILMVLGPGLGADWSQWRGPSKSGVTAESGWKLEGNPETSWRHSVGLGYSAVAVAGGRLFTLGFDVEKKIDILTCVSADSGEELWTHKYAADIWNQGHEGGTLSTPTVDGDRVYIKDREGKLFCLEAKSGKVLWSKDLIKDLSAKTEMWGFASTPLIVDDVLYIDVGILFAFKKADGELLWQTRDYGQAYATPVDFEWNGLKALALMNKTGLVIVDLEEGKELCTHEWPSQNGVNASTPVVIDDHIFIASGMGCAMLQFLEDKLEVVWESKVMKTSMNGVVFHEDHLYGFDGSMLKCIDLDGNELWRERGLGSGSLIVADDKLVVLSEKGELLIADASSDGFEVKSRAKVLEDGVCWTMPILCDGRIYCRNSKGTLVARDHRPAK